MNTKHKALDHIARHGFTAGFALEQLCGGKRPNNLIAALSSEGLIQSHGRVLPPGRSVYTLTKSGAKSAGYPKSSCSRPSPTVIAKTLPVLFLCSTEKAFARPHPQAFRDIPGSGQWPEVTRLVHRQRGGLLQVLLVYIPDTDPATAIQHIADRVERLEGFPEASSLLRSRELGTLVLAETREFCKEMKSQDKFARLHKRSPILLKQAPGESGLSRALEQITPRAES